MDNTTVTETALIKVNPETDLDVVNLRDEALKLQAYAVSMVVADAAGAKLATDDLSILSKLKKQIELKRREWIDPISTHLAEVNQAFKSFTAPVEEADKCLRWKILNYKAEIERQRVEAAEINRRAEELARQQAAMNGGEFTQELSPATVAKAPEKTITTDLGSSSTVKLRKWRLVDIRQVPVEYLKVDEAAIGKLVRAGISAISGIEIYTEETLRINARGDIK